MWAMFSTEALETRLWSLCTFLEAWLIVNAIILNIVKGKPAIPSCSWCSWTGTRGKSARKSPSLLTRASASLETSQTLRVQVHQLWCTSMLLPSPERSAHWEPDWAALGVPERNSGTGHLALLLQFPACWLEFIWCSRHCSSCFSPHQVTLGPFIASPASTHLLNTCPPQAALKPSTLLSPASHPPPTSPPQPWPPPSCFWWPASVTLHRLESEFQGEVPKS